MIASLRGSVLSIGSGGAVIETGGVGLQFQATANTLATLRIGHEGQVYTSLVVREDALTLYGFADEDERDVFNTLTTITGIGPRTALAVLGVHRPDELRLALERKDEAALTRVPGIGKKSAQRMLLELGSKLGPVRGETPVAASSGTTSVEVLEALTNLGWSEREAAPALEEAMAKVPSGSIADLLRASLQILGSRR
ncbi:MAG: Holliday junction branch migration protein RuvA [Actinomycetaceae bacterium]|nr:Holliday junction branch migration protein RuvA [Actinomycetaceae bacterium]